MQDVVTRGGKFVVLYKRPGKRIILNNEGRLMVPPSSMEASIQQSIGGTYKLPPVKACTNPYTSLVSCMLSAQGQIAQDLIVKVVVVQSVGQKVDHHLLTSYHQAILSVILAQFTPKGFIDGMEGIVRLVEGHEGLQASMNVFVFLLHTSMQHLSPVRAQDGVVHQRHCLPYIDFACACKAGFLSEQRWV